VWSWVKKGGNSRRRGARRAERRPNGQAIRYVETDESGFFLIDRLDFGDYYVGAMKKEEGYNIIAPILDFSTTC
jgi:hypothetical protein